MYVCMHVCMHVRKLSVFECVPVYIDLPSFKYTRNRTLKTHTQNRFGTGFKLALLP